MTSRALPPNGRNEPPARWNSWCSVAKLCPALHDPTDCSIIRPPCPSPSPKIHLCSCLLNRWCHPTISSSVALVSFCLQSFPALKFFPVSQLFTSGGQSIGASASASVLRPQSRKKARVSGGKRLVLRVEASAGTSMRCCEVLYLSGLWIFFLHQREVGCF